ncbi:MAG: SufD family Fe-S cluster assembly protein [Oscillospiraceae bacterium]|nr:SufD family Fe-S cluster assembly protein [Oscillospiraceae bacterium]
MSKIDQIQADLLEMVAGLRGAPKEGAFNIRLNGKSAGHSGSSQVSIEFKAAGSGIDVRVAPGTKGEKIYIPVVISESGMREIVYNDFYIGEGAEVEIIAGCAVHNCAQGVTQHDGVHAFRLEKGARVLYKEKHYGSGEGTGERVLNPVTECFLGEGSYMEMDTVQIKGVDSTRRLTRGKVGKNATLIVREKLMTHGSQRAETRFEVAMEGAGSGVNLISRSVARDRSSQVFFSKIEGNNACTGHSECDAIIMDEAIVRAVPEIIANHVDASLIHEAAIGKIAGEQLIKLMTLGLTRQEAEEQIIGGFLK